MPADEAVNQGREAEVREQELREKGKCGICGKGIGHAGAMHLYRVRVEQYITNVPAMRRQDGLAAMLGGHTMLARVMGPDEEMAQKASSQEMTVCSECIGADLLGIRVSEQFIKTEAPSKVKPLSEVP